MEGVRVPDVGFQVQAIERRERDNRLRALRLPDQQNYLGWRGSWVGSRATARSRRDGPLSGEFGTYKTVKARLWRHFEETLNPKPPHRRCCLGWRGSWVGGARPR